jgi:hypothetical protein
MGSVAAAYAALDLPPHLRKQCFLILSSPALVPAYNPSSTHYKRIPYYLLSLLRIVDAQPGVAVKSVRNVPSVVSASILRLSLMTLELLLHLLLPFLVYSSHFWWFGYVTYISGPFVGFVL